MRWFGNPAGAADLDSAEQSGDSAQQFTHINQQLQASNNNVATLQTRVTSLNVRMETAHGQHAEGLKAERCKLATVIRDHEESTSLAESRHAAAVGVHQGTEAITRKVRLRPKRT